VGKNDLTKEVIEELNKEAPEEYRTKKPTLAVPEPPLGK
jgi:hypothetical protein